MIVWYLTRAFNLTTYMSLCTQAHCSLSLRIHVLADLCTDRPTIHVLSKICDNTGGQYTEWRALERTESRSHWVGLTLLKW